MATGINLQPMGHASIKKTLGSIASIGLPDRCIGDIALFLAQIWQERFSRGRYLRTRYYFITVIKTKKMKNTNLTPPSLLSCLMTSVLFIQPAIAQNQANEKITRIGNLEWDLHEVTVATVKIYAEKTGFVSSGEREGGSFIYESGWTRKSQWNWRQPFGIEAKNNEPAVHLNFHEAKAICSFFGKRLPTDSEWSSAAFLEQRITPTQPFTKGKRYTYPHGDTPKNSHCLNGCAGLKGTAPSGSLWRGHGHVPVMTTQAGVNGLYDMGGNAWEWVDTAIGSEKVTRGASWWYGPENQLESNLASKSPDTKVAYVGFRCVRDVQ
jgi:formylglycine-generating enzyme